MSRIKSVDFVKGVAIFWITIYHAYWHIYGSVSSELGGYMGDMLTPYVSALQTSLWDGIFNVFCGLGYQGVAIFIVMSGFLQAWSNRKKGPGDSSLSMGYIMKRALRIYPLYWIAIVIVIVFRLSQGVTLGVPDYNLVVWPISINQIVMDVMALQVLSPFHMFSLNMSFWFVGMIIQMYLVFPFMSRLNRRLGDKRFLLVSLALTLGCLYVSQSVAWIHFLFAMAFFGSWLFLFSFGMVLANNYERLLPFLTGLKAVVPFFLLYYIGVILCSKWETWPFGRLLYGSAMALFLLSLHNSIAGSRILGLPRRLFEFMGRISYALYLTNEPYSQAYFALVTGLPLIFTGGMTEGYGVPENLQILTIGPFLAVFATYAAILILGSYLLTRIDTLARRKLSFPIIAAVLISAWVCLLYFRSPI